MNDLQPRSDLLDKIILDSRRRTPLHLQLHRALLRLIEEHFDGGDSFYTEMMLVQRLGISRSTVRQALGDLTREGYLSRRAARGTTVTKAGRPLLPVGGIEPGNIAERVARAYVGVFVSETSFEYMTALLQCVTRECRVRDLAVNTYYTHSGEDIGRVYRQVHQPPDVERFVLIQPPDTTVELNEALSDRGYRTVAFEMPSSDYFRPVVATNARMAVQVGVDYLRSLGHTRIALLVGDPVKTVSVRHKIEHFRMILPQGRVVVNETDSPADSFEAAYLQMRDVWPDDPTLRPTAVMTTSDPCAWAALRWFTEQGVRVPDDVSVLGFEDARSSRFMLPALSTIAHPIEQLAREALDILWVPGEPQEQRFIAPELIIRASTGPAPG